MKEIQAYLAELIHAQMEQRKPTPIPEGIDPDEIFKIAFRNQMCYLLLAPLVRVDNLAKEKKEHYSVYVLNSLQRTLMQVTELKKYVQRCEENGIKNQPLKGSHMKFLYPSPEMREMSDIDILIDEKKMKEFGKMLKDDGYEMTLSVPHHDVYNKEPFMVIEAHRTIYDETVDKKQNDYFASFRRTHLKEGSKYSYVFNEEDFYIYMIAHMAKHFYARGCGVRNLVDIYVYLKKYQEKMNWEYIETELEKCGLWQFTQHMQTLTFIWLETQEWTEFYENLIAYMLDSGIYGKDANGIWNRFAEKGNQNREISAKQLKKWYYFPPLSYMAEEYSWVEEHTWLLPVAWCVRGFHGIFKKTGASKVKMLEEVSKEEIQVYKEIYQNMGLHFRK